MDDAGYGVSRIIVPKPTITELMHLDVVHIRLVQTRFVASSMLVGIEIPRFLTPLLVDDKQRFRARTATKGRNRTERKGNTKGHLGRTISTRRANTARKTVNPIVKFFGNVGTMIVA